MGDIGIFFERATQSPKIDYCAIAGVQQNLRLCDSFVGRYSFRGDAACSLRHYFQRTDGAILSVLGSVAARHDWGIKGEVKAITDLYQRPIPWVKTEGRIVFLQSNISYVLSVGPLEVISVVARETESVRIRNEGFENFSGDSFDGFSGCLPIDWIYREKKFDPGGSIAMTGGARSGKVAIRLHASGKGPVYVFQEMTVRSPGQYRVSGWFRPENPNGNLVPYLFVLDNNTGKLSKSGSKLASVEIASNNEFTLYDLLVDIPVAGSLPLAIGFGIFSGEGDMVLDDVEVAQILPVNNQSK